MKNAEKERTALGARMSEKAARTALGARMSEGQKDSAWRENVQRNSRWSRTALGRENVRAA